MICPHWNVKSGSQYLWCLYWLDVLLLQHEVTFKDHFQDDTVFKEVCVPRSWDLYPLDPFMHSGVGSHYQKLLFPNKSSGGWSSGKIQLWSSNTKRVKFKSCLPLTPLQTCVEWAWSSDRSRKKWNTLLRDGVSDVVEKCDKHFV